MRKIYINNKLYNGEMLPAELDNQISNVIDAYEELTPEQKKHGYEYGDFLIIDEN